MLCPMALPIWANTWRNRLPSRASRNSHPAASRSTQHSAVDEGSGARLVSRSRNTKPMEHPSIANQVLSNESQVILSTQHSAVVLTPSKGSDLWVIERGADRLLTRADWC